MAIINRTDIISVRLITAVPKDLTTLNISRRDSGDLYRSRMSVVGVILVGFPDSDSCLLGLNITRLGPCNSEGSGHKEILPIRLDGGPTCATQCQLRFKRPMLMNNDTKNR